MTEKGPQIENTGNVVEAVKRGIDKVIHPVSSAREKQFRQIISVLPEGALKKSYQDTLPQLREMLKLKDIDLLKSEIITRTFSAIWGGFLVGWGVAASGVAGPAIGIPAIAIGSAAAVGGTLWPWGPIAHERKAISNEAINYKQFYSSPAGKDSAKMWDKVPGGNVDQIVRTIVMGSATMRGTPGSVSPMPGIPSAGGMIS